MMHPQCSERHLRSTVAGENRAMAVALPNASERAAIIGYLETLGVTISAQAQAPAAVELPPPGAGPTQDELNHAPSDTQNWMYASKDYSGQRFVNLAQINTKNAHQLRAVCMIRSETAAPTQTDRKSTRLNSS